jgi:hypothetical protein
MGDKYARRLRCRDFDRQRAGTGDKPQGFIGKHLTHFYLLRGVQ